MTKEQAWQAILPIVNLASQPDTERARAVVANRLVSQFPNGLGKYATLAVKASLADLIQSRYAENRADRDASAINRRQPSREI